MAYDIGVTATTYQVGAHPPSSPPSLLQVPSAKRRQLTFTYDVAWVHSEIRWASRRDVEILLMEEIRLTC